MVAIDVRSTGKLSVLPEGADGSLWSVRPECGLFDFRGHVLRIEVPDPTEILFPTDCGLSLLAAIREDADIHIHGRRVLNVGCGSGIYSVAMLAAGASHVTALDVNAAAGAVTRANVARNFLNVNRLSWVQGDMAQYAPVDVFDVIVSNPPHLPYSPLYANENGLELALIGGSSGRALYDALIDRVDDVLAPGGMLLIAHSSLAGIEQTKRRMAALGYGCRTLEIFEMDIPLRAYAGHADVLAQKLRCLRREGEAVFSGNRFFVHALEFRRREDTACER